MIYKHENFTFIYDGRKGSKLYKDRHLIFVGNSWSGILLFLSETKNAPEVREMFKAQLNHRENPKRREERKSKYEEIKKPKVEEPKPEPVKKPKRTKPKTPWDD